MCAVWETRHRRDPLVKANRDAFMSVTNGVQRERARVALEPVSTVDGDRIRRIHRGQWSDKDDPLVRANPVPFAPLEDEDAAA